MTFPEECTTELMDNATDRSQMKSGNTMKNILQKAVAEGRATCGAFQCAQFLQNTPENVAMCVLPVSPVQEDVAIQIQHTLIQAFCWENEIRVVKVDTMDKLCKILTANIPEDDNNNAPKTIPLDADFSTVLIQNEDVFTQSNHEKQTALSQLLEPLLEGTPDPVIELPE